MDTLLTLYDYIIRILPGLLLMALVFGVLKPRAGLRVIIYISSFILMRDALTPLGLWKIGKTDGIFWLRLSTDPVFLILFGLCSLLMVMALFAFDRENRQHLIWFKKKKLIGLILGIIGGMAVVLPYFILYRGIEIGQRGGAVDTALHIPIFIFALFGNLFEEGLFRGYVLGSLQFKQNRLWAGLASGVVFAFCHVFLAITITDVGLPLLLFVLWEGVIAGLVGAGYGIIPSTLCHGGAVFLLSSGLF